MLWKYFIPCCNVTTKLWTLIVEEFNMQCLLEIQNNSESLIYTCEKKSWVGAILPSNTKHGQNQYSTGLIRDKSPARHQQEQNNQRVNFVRQVKDCCVMSLGLFQTARDRVNFPSSRGKMRYLHRRSNSLIKSLFIAEQIAILSALGHNEALSSQ